jgi:hypothetical protein
MRVIVCGGRDFFDSNKGFAALDAVHAATPIKHLWHGNARGADSIADAWARARGVNVHPVPADWQKYGRRAGPKRNQNMLGQCPDLVIALPGGRGTADMVRRAKNAGVPVKEIT